MNFDKNLLPFQSLPHLLGDNLAGVELGMSKWVMGRDRPSPTENNSNYVTQIELVIKNWGLLWHENLGNAGSFFEHRMPIENNDDHRHDCEKEVVPGLSIRPNGIHHLEVIQVSDQEAATRCIE